MLPPIPMHRTMGSLLLTHTQSHRLFFNLSSKSRSKNSKDKVSVEAEAQSTVRKDRPPQSLSLHPGVSLPHPQRSPFALMPASTACEPLNHMTQEARLSLDPLPREGFLGLLRKANPSVSLWMAVARSGAGHLSFHNLPLQAT